MHQLPWEEYDAEQTPRLVAEINSQLKDVQFDDMYTTVRTQSVPFYAEHEFIELTDATKTPALVRRAIYKPGEFYILNWTNQPIYMANEKAPIIINEDNAVVYVNFFFHFVKGRHGRFVLIDSPQEINWSSPPPEKGMQALQNMIKPLAVTDVEDDGTINLLSFMVFKDSLFRAKVQVKRDGMVSLTDEALVVEGMPIVEDVVPEEG
ncbi:MAG TPA: hypothetical protein VGF14_00350 [Alphaproteobacteria bacterium]